eukprot:2864023-Alexandrium_andersonii.AAC.1
MRRGGYAGSADQETHTECRVTNADCKAPSGHTVTRSSVPTFEWTSVLTCKLKQRAHTTVNEKRQQQT